MRLTKAQTVEMREVFFNIFGDLDLEMTHDGVFKDRLVQATYIGFVFAWKFKQQEVNSLELRAKVLNEILQEFKDEKN